ncbi:MAG: fasciclin domain-containing protein, partial [Actinobacteria bacterium]|nr:fasciclin domain-containing protein [Actinomycetota bacterium]
GELTPAELPGKHTTLEGQDITVTGSGESFTINGTSQVVCGNVKTANATVYVIDGVLLPPS